MLFAAFSGPILATDAKLISWVVGTRSTGNAIPFADGSGVLFLEPACSSLTNVSLALLCGLVIVNFYGLQWSRTVAATILAACVTTIVINVARIGAIGVLPAYYDVIHGPFGATVAAWVTNLAVVAIYAGGLRPDAPVHA
jgi:exosortase/archaeosortase family protein